MKIQIYKEMFSYFRGMEPSDVARVISAPLTGLFIDYLVPRIHMMADLTAANDSLNLNHAVDDSGIWFLLFPSMHIYESFVECSGFLSHSP